jgi:hypothetical protein
MATHRKRLFLFAAALLPALALAVLLVDCPRRPQVDAAWTPQRLRDELERRGLVYEAKEIPIPNCDGLNPGFYLRNPERGLPWPELLANTRRYPESMRGCVVLTGGGRLGADEQEPGRAQLGPYVLTGDPVEICRILDAFR